MISFSWDDRKNELNKKNMGFHSMKPKQCFLMRTPSDILIRTIRIMKTGF